MSSPSPRPTGTGPTAPDGVPAAAPDATADATGPDARTAPARTTPTIWDQMGGPAGMLDSGLPVVVFVIANGIGGLTAGIVAALVAGAAIFAFRLARRKPVTQAVSGLLGVGIAAFIAYKSGSAGGYFKLGIWSYLVYGSALLVSMIVRWPAVGLIWEGINGRGTAWRRDRALVRRYDYATLVWVVVFAARYLVQNALLGRDEIGWLGFARIAMGYPLWILAIGASVLIVMRGTGWKRPPLTTLLGKKS
ncbi:DUF3159 domain-containing protein [Nakamurella deserti]|uniref:DUF3159 domain-containing protein n=1 Tax=Nakamurella deserti TaxID=2164074 RepID=UPI001F0C4C90|nr:DUF3159 domain-containing protein [Nakamurella deserti]